MLPRQRDPQDGGNPCHIATIPFESAGALPSVPRRPPAPPSAAARTRSPPLARPIPADRPTIRTSSPRAPTMPEIAPAPTTPGTRYVSLAGIDFKPISDIAVYSSPFGLRAQLRDGEHVHGARRSSRTVPASPRWSSTRRIPTADSIVVRLVCHRSSVASTSAVFNVATLDTTSPTQSSVVRTAVRRGIARDDRSRRRRGGSGVLRASRSCRLTPRICSGE